jgi:C4-dicarboxylate transporter, DctM subunit
MEYKQMSMWILSLITIGVFIALLICGVRVAFAALISGIITLFLVYHNMEVVGNTVANMLYSSNAQYPMTVIPLFVFMGYIALEYGIGNDIFYTARCWLGRLPGGLAIGTVFGSAFFGAINGSSPVAVAVFGKIAVPEMEKAGYDWKLAIGSVAGSGGLSELIPPSTLMVIFAILANVSVGKCLIAGFIPGIISALALFLMIYFRCKVNPRLGPVTSAISLSEKIKSIKYLIPGVIVLVIIMGGLFLGVFTPTEAGAWSTFTMLICGIITIKRFDLRPLWKAVLSATRTSCMVLILLFGIKVMTTAITATGSLTAMVEFFMTAQVHPYVLLCLALVIYLILGMFVGVNAMLVMTVPFFVPVFAGLGFDPIWFGVIVVIMCEIGLLTPPIAGNIFIISQVTGKELSGCFKSIPWFIGVHTFVVLILILFPQLALFLPNIMK